MVLESDFIGNLSGRPDTFVDVADLPLTIEKEDYENPWSPSNPNGSVSAAVKFSLLVDQGRPLQINGQASSSRTISKAYDQIIRLANCSDGICRVRMHPHMRARQHRYTPTRMSAQDDFNSARENFQRWQRFPNGQNMSTPLIVH